MTDHNPFAAADALAPMPATREQATTDAWIRHYAALAAAAWAYFRRMQASPGFDVGMLADVAVAATAAAHALTSPADPGELWDITPEAGALNGEWEEWLADTLDAHGINPADIDPAYNAADFRCPTRTGAR